jgi:hypothetical protein
MLFLTRRRQPAFQASADEFDQRLRGEQMTSSVNTEITIRRVDLTDEDRARLAGLAERDSSAAPTGPVLGLEVEGALLAAVSLNTGEAIADPFSRTGELRGLLELRATQIRRRDGKRPRRLGRRRPAVGGSPAGSIITLPRWG